MPGEPTTDQPMPEDVAGNRFLTDPAQTDEDVAGNRFLTDPAQTDEDVTGNRAWVDTGESGEAEGSGEAPRFS